ncbi:N-acetyltransferase family protein [Pseudonocardia xinjiangensis]|uniref:GNAT family N-acetyltransferase n=1 Tax=Pseudonocardia xinjiangensis TaxID=75289 RepID=UPI003D8D09E5
MSPAAVHVRPLDRWTAGHAVDTVFAQLSPRSRYLRFHSAVPRLPAPVRAALVDLDGRSRAAVVAETCGPDGPAPVGIARIARTDPGTAEIAVAVVDDWQRQGIGRLLVSAVATLAEELGYTALRGGVLPENVAMLGLARSVFPPATRHFDGDVVQLAVPLGPAAWTVTDEDVLADLVSR